MNRLFLETADGNKNMNSLFSLKLFYLLAGNIEAIGSNLVLLILLEHENLLFTEENFVNTLLEKYSFPIDWSKEAVRINIKELEDKNWIIQEGQSLSLRKDIFYSYKESFIENKKHAYHVIEKIQDYIQQYEIRFSSNSRNLELWTIFQENVLLPFLAILILKLNERDVNEEWSLLAREISHIQSEIPLQKIKDWISYLEKEYPVDFSTFVTLQMRTCFFKMKLENVSIKLEGYRDSNLVALFLRTFLITLNTFYSLKTLHTSLSNTVNNMFLSWVDKSVLEQIDLEKSIVVQMENLKVDFNREIKDIYKLESESITNLKNQLEEKIQKFDKIEREYNKLLSYFKEDRSEKDKERRVRDAEEKWDSARRKVNVNLSNQIKKEKDAKNIQLGFFISTSILFTIFVSLGFSKSININENRNLAFIIASFLFGIPSVSFGIIFLMNIIKYKRFDYINHLATEKLKETKNELYSNLEVYEKNLKDQLSSLSPEKASQMAPIYYNIHGGTNVFGETIHTIHQNEGDSDED